MVSATKKWEARRGPDAALFPWGLSVALALSPLPVSPSWTRCVLQHRRCTPCAAPELSC